MRNTIRWSLAGVSTLGLWAASTQGAIWTSTGLPAPGVTTSASLTDYDNIQFGSIVSDSAGRIFVAMQTAAGGGGTAAGKVAIYTPSGNAYSVSVLDLTALGVAGPVTKLVVAGTGAFESVYGLQSWTQIGSANDSSGLVSRIIRINSNGSVDTVFAVDGRPGTTVGKRLYGMTVGGSPDYSVYFTNSSEVGGDAGKGSNFWKFDVTQPISGTNPAVRGAGFGEHQRMFNLEYAGREGAHDYFALIANNIGSEPGAVANIPWWPDTVFNDASYARNSNGAYLSQPGYRDWITATAYDAAAIRKTLWVAGRGSVLNKGWRPKSNISTAHRSTFIVDLGGGNYAMKSFKEAGTTSGNYPYWKRELGDTGNGMPSDSSKGMLVTRFTVQSMTSNYASYIMRVAGRAQALGGGLSKSASCGLGVRWVSGVPHLQLINIGDPLGLPSIPAALIKDLGVIDIGTGHFYEVGMYAEAVSNTSTILRAWLDGTEVTGSPFTLSSGQVAQTGEVAFGAGCRTNPSGAEPDDIPSSAIVYFDWAGIDVKLLTPPYASSSFRTGPLGLTSLQAAGTDGILACYLNGSTVPENTVSSNSANRWNGQAANAAFFTGGVPGSGSVPGVSNPATVWVPNGNSILPDGNTLTAGSNSINGGRYWVSALAVNPCDGAAWMSIGGEQSDLGHYTPDGALPFSAEGKAFTIGYNANIVNGDEGAPLAANTSQILALYFQPPSGKTILALAADKGTGAYSLYKANNPGACCNTPPADVEPGTLGSGGAFGDSDVDMNDFAVFQKCYKTAPLTAVCACLDFDHSGVVDDTDEVKFENCVIHGGKGTGVAAAANCAN